MVGDHPVGDVLLPVRSAVGVSDPSFQSREVGREQVGVVVRQLPLEDGEDALETHARVHRFGGELTQAAVVETIELHEHQVPQLDEALVAGIDADRRVGSIRRVAPRAAAIDVDLATGPTGARVPHLPEVVFLPEAEDAIGRDVGHLAPQFLGFDVGGEAVLLVTAEDRDPQPLLGELVHAGQQFPGPLDRITLEVVPEGPVAEHLEEGVVVGVDPHLFEIVVLTRDPNAFLGVDRPSVVPRAGSQEHVLELVHSRVGEQERRIVLREDRAGRDFAVRSLREEVEEHAACLAGGRLGAHGHCLGYEVEHRSGLGGHTD